MIEVRQILCPIDFSEHSRRALDQAIAIAYRYQARITALHVRPVAADAGAHPRSKTSGITKLERQHMLLAVERFIEAETPREVRVEAALREGDPATEILSAATAMGADLLVMGSHGRAGFDRLLLGSASETVLRTADCPVLTIPHRQPDTVPAYAVLLRHILCAVDFSDSSMRALDCAISLAQEADATLTVMHVLQHGLFRLPTMSDLVRDHQPESVDEYMARHEAEAQQAIKAALPSDAGMFCTLATITTRGQPAVEVLRVARERQIDLIVLGVQGRGAVDLAVFGSTAQQVVRESSCPVLTMREGLKALRSRVTVRSPDRSLNGSTNSTGPAGP